MDRQFSFLTIVITISVISLTGPIGYAQTTSVTTETLKSQFPGMVQSEKYDEAQTLLKKWEQLSPDDADLAVAKANFILSLPDAKSHLVVAALDDAHSSIPDGVKPGAMKLVDSKTSQTAGFIGEVPGENADKARAQAIQILSDAERRYPNRLDIRLGIISLISSQGDYNKTYNLLNQTVKYTAGIKFHGMTGEGNEKIKDCAVDIADAVHHYYSEYSRGTENPDNALALKFAELGTEYFPEDPRMWNNLAAEYSQTDLPKSIECLQKAHKLDPEDAIILMNIAHFYTLMNKSEEAIETYKKVIELKDQEYANNAKAQILKIKAEQQPDMITVPEN